MVVQVPRPKGVRLGILCTEVEAMSSATSYDSAERGEILVMSCEEVSAQCLEQARSSVPQAPRVRVCLQMLEGKSTLTSQMLLHLGVAFQHALRGR